MKKFFKNCIKVFLMLVITCVILSKPSQADVGYFSSYDSGGASSYDLGGASSYDSGGSSSSWDSDWSSSSSDDDYSSSSSSSPASLMYVILLSVIYIAGNVFIIFIVFIVLKISTNKTNKKSKEYYEQYAKANEQKEEEIKKVEETIKQIDPMFSAEEFMQWSKEVFIKLQTAWMDRKWEEIRLFESNELFEQHRSQLQQLIDTNRINIVKDICVTHTNLESFRQDGDKEILKMTLKSTMKDYIIDADTKKVLVGNVNQDIYMIYTLTFMRKTGVKTKEDMDKKSTTNCPNCGAPTKITSSGKCEYCESIITTGEHDWVLSNLEGKHGR